MRLLELFSGTGSIAEVFIEGGWRRCIYWLAAATLTFVVTW